MAAVARSPRRVFLEAARLLDLEAAGRPTRGGYFSTDSQGLLGEQNWAKVRRAEGQGGVLHGFLTECYLLLKDTAAGNMANKLYISQFIIGDHWENFYSHCWHGLGAARLLAEIFADNLPLQVTGGLHRCNRCNRGPTCNRCNRCR